MTKVQFLSLFLDYHLLVFIFLTINMNNQPDVNGLMCRDFFFCCECHVFNFVTLCVSPGTWADVLSHVIARCFTCSRVRYLPTGRTGFPGRERFPY